MWESKQEYGEERRDDSKSNDDESNSDRGRDLNTSDDLDDDDDSKHKGIVTQDIEPTDTLKDA